MQIWLRLFRVGRRALRHAGRARPNHLSRLDFRVALGDIDVNGHMNNGRVITLMDLGRIDLLIRTGVYREMRRRGVTGVVAAQRVRYRAALAFGDRFRLESRILAWPDEGVVFDHVVWRVRRGGEVLAATARFVFIPRRRARGRRVVPSEVLRGARWGATSPAVPDETRAWLEAERQIFARAPSALIKGELISRAGGG